MNDSNDRHINSLLTWEEREALGLGMPAKIKPAPPTNARVIPVSELPTYELDTQEIGTGVFGMKKARFGHDSYHVIISAIKEGMWGLGMVMAYLSVNEIEAVPAPTEKKDTLFIGITALTILLMLFFAGMAIFTTIDSPTYDRGGFLTGDRF